MAKNLIPAKTPGVAIARVLRGLGLKQGTDFGVRAERKNGERIGTRVAVFGPQANQTVAENADLIERQAGDAGFHFNVSVYFTPSGITWVAVANFGERTRQTHFLSATPAEPVAAEDQPLRDRAVALADESMAEPKACTCECTWQCDRPADEPCTCPCTCGAVKPEGRARTLDEYLAERKHGIRTRTAVAPKPVIHATLDAPRPAFEQPEAKRLADRVKDAAYYYPKGQRVQGSDNYGVTCMGTVNGVAWGVVTDPNHANYGRTWVDVDWDEMPHNRGTGRRSRPFTSDLIKH